MNSGRGQRSFVIVFLAPAFCLYTVFFAIPAVRALLYSLQRWDGFGQPEWIGLENFARLFSESDLFVRAFAHNLWLLAAGGGGTLILALFFASVIHRRVRGAKLFRICFFFPNVISGVAIALLWLLLYSATDFGVFNALLRQVDAWGAGIGVDLVPLELPVAFTDSKHLLYAIVPMMVWTFTGFYMVLFLAAMEAIPESFYEVARLEGAGPVAQFRYVTLPLIREVLVIACIFLLIMSMKFFDPIWVMENGRPTGDTHVLATLLYEKVFTEYNVGYGAAVAVVLFIIVFAATLATLMLSRREALEY